MMKRKLMIGSLTIVLVLAVFIPSLLWLQQRITHYKTDRKSVV